MSSVLLGLTLIAVFLLTIWSVKDQSRPSKIWWMFAIRDPVAGRPQPRQGPFRSGRQAPDAGKPAQRAWRRSGS